VRVFEIRASGLRENSHSFDSATGHLNPLLAVSSVRSERQLIERLEFGVLLRWFGGLSADGLRNGWAGILSSVPESQPHRLILHGA
jgi:hypothetical protein